MIFRQSAFIAVMIIIGTTMTLFLTQSWRKYIISLSIQYVGVFWLIGLIMPIGLAAVKLIVGWMAGAVLSASQSQGGLFFGKQDTFSGKVFRLLSAVFIIILCFLISPSFADWLSTDQAVVQGALVLMGMGLLHLGMTSRPLRVIVALLTLLSGFEIIHSILETSVLVTGLLAMVNLGLALTGAFLLFGYEGDYT